jgi:hypothetical protein
MAKGVLITESVVMTVNVSNYEDLRRKIKGKIRGINLGKNFIYLNEDGKELGLEPNYIATKYCFENNLESITGDLVYGDILVMGSFELDGFHNDVW